MVPYDIIVLFGRKTVFGPLFNNAMLSKAGRARNLFDSRLFLF